MIEPYRVVEHTTLGFSFEQYADSEEEALQILSRLVQMRLDEKKSCRARVEIRVGDGYKPLSEQPKLLPPTRHIHYVPLGTRFIQPDCTDRIMTVVQSRFAPIHLRSIGAEEGVFLTELHIGMTRLALTERGNFNSPLPLSEIDATRHNTHLDEILQDRPPIRPGLVISGMVRNESSRPVAVALFMSGVEEKNGEEES